MWQDYRIQPGALLRIKHYNDVIFPQLVGRSEIRAGDEDECKTAEELKLFKKNVTRNYTVALKRQISEAVKMDTTPDNLFNKRSEWQYRPMSILIVSM